MKQKKTANAATSKLIMDKVVQEGNLQIAGLDIAHIGQATSFSLHCPMLALFVSLHATVSNKKLVTITTVKAINSSNKKNKHKDVRTITVIVLSMGDYTLFLTIMGRK